MKTGTTSTPPSMLTGFIHELTRQIEAVTSLPMRQSILELSQDDHYKQAVELYISTVNQLCKVIAERQLTTAYEQFQEVLLKEKLIANAPPPPPDRVIREGQQPEKP